MCEEGGAVPEVSATVTACEELPKIRTGREGLPAVYAPMWLPTAVDGQVLEEVMTV